MVWSYGNLLWEKMNMVMQYKSATPLKFNSYSTADKPKKSCYKLQQDFDLLK
jgi:hypothetical protein